MNKRTANELATQLRTIREDANGNVYTDAVLTEIIDSAVTDLHLLLVSVHRDGMVGVEWPWALLVKDDFSYANTVTLPDDYCIWIETRKEGEEEPIEIVPWKEIFDDTDNDYACIYASSLSSPLPDPENEGTDDFEIRGDYSGAVDAEYSVQIDGTGTTFKWSSDNGGTWTGTLVAIPDEWYELESGIYIKFQSTSGYTVGDRWNFDAYISSTVSIMKLNFDPEDNIEFTYTRKPTEISTIGDDYEGTYVYLPYPQFYEPLKGIAGIRCRAFNEENVNIEAYINSVAMKRVKEIMRLENMGSKLKYSVEYPDHESYL